MPAIKGMVAVSSLGRAVLYCSYYSTLLKCGTLLLQCTVRGIFLLLPPPPPLILKTCFCLESRAEELLAGMEWLVGDGGRKEEEGEGKKFFPIYFTAHILH